MNSGRGSRPLGLSVQRSYNLRTGAERTCSTTANVAGSQLAVWEHRELMPTEQPDRPAPHFQHDAQPDPEPAAPSLSEPDPGVFHHEPATTNPRGDGKDTP